MTDTYYFSLPNITCINCVMPVENALRDCTALTIEQVRVDVVDKTIAISVQEQERYSESDIRQLLKKEIENTGVDCVDIGTESSKFLIYLIKGIAGCAAGIAILILSCFGMSLPIATLYMLGAACTLLTVILGADTYYEAAKKLFTTQTLTMDVLFTVSTWVAVGVSVASLFVPGLPMMFEASLLILGFRYIGKAIKESIKQKITCDLKFCDRAPREVILLNKENNTPTTYPTQQLQANDVILIRKNEIIPVDGECLEDSSSIYDTIISGSTLPRTIRKGENVLAGMRVAEDVECMLIKVIHSAATSYLASLDEDILHANMEKAPIETTANQLLQYFIPTVFALAAFSYSVISLIFTPVLGTQCAISLLVAACPCTLGFITPLAIKIGISKASENGVQFKNGKALQAAANIDTVVFDLNGTLTRGTPTVISYQVTSPEVQANELLAYMALMEKTSGHPVAKAIIQFTENNVTDSFDKVTISDIDKPQHCGVSAKINNDIFVIGNKKMMDMNGIAVDYLQQSQRYQAGEQIIYLARNNKVIGFVVLHDPLRNDAKQTVLALQESGKEVYICTGADNETAQSYAKQLGIPKQNVHADCVGSGTPIKNMSKVQFISRLQEEGHCVAMVGDAGNDAVAIAKSDLGIAMKSNAADKITQQEAGVVIHNSFLTPVANAFVVAKQTVTNIKQNLSISLGYNMAMLLVAGVLLLTLGVALNPGLCVLLMVMQSSIVLLNAYHFKCQNVDSHQSQGCHDELNNQNQKTVSSYHQMRKQGITPSFLPRSGYSDNSKISTVTLPPKSPPNLETLSPSPLAPENMMTNGLRI
jgi:P-type Cu2+ transporter